MFKLDPATSEETVLYRFNGTDGANPAAGLIFDAKGNLYGTTYAGGNLSDCNGNGCGVVFKLDPTTRNETILYRFTGADGANPAAGLILDAKGNLYGTTEHGGTSGDGMVFKVSKSGRYTVLYGFTGADGGNPRAGLIFDAEEDLYGTTYYGGSRDGTVFKLTR